jgi:hypothetical protein
MRTGRKNNKYKIDGQDDGHNAMTNVLNDKKFEIFRNHFYNSPNTGQKKGGKYSRCVKRITKSRKNQRRTRFHKK